MKSKNKSHISNQEVFPSDIPDEMDDIIAYGGEINEELIIEAYSKGIFPWPQGKESDIPLLWYCPRERGVLFFNELKIPKSLQKFLNKINFENKITTTINQNFLQVMKECQKQYRKGQSGTWILDEMLEVYPVLQKKGLALSVEVWKEKNLVGGIYGVLINNVFSGESMFHKDTNMSKVALLKLIDYLKSRGINWMDIQMVTPLLKQFGGRYVPRKEYLKLIRN